MANDKNNKIDKNTVLLKCRILGVHITASLQDIKTARDHLAKLYHPDRHPNVSEAAKLELNKRFQLIQEAYTFLKTHYDTIQEYFKYVKEFTLTSQEAKFKAHWIYSEIAHYA